MSEFGREGMSGKAKNRTELEAEVREMEALIRKYKDCEDPKTCWARYILATRLAAQRRRLRKLVGET